MNFFLSKPLNPKASIMQIHYDTPHRKIQNNTRDKETLIKDLQRDYVLLIFGVGDKSAGLGTVHMHRGAKL